MSNTITINSTETYYMLRVKETENYLYYERTSNDNGDFCGEYTVRLTESDWQENGHFKVKDYYHALWVLHNSTPWYNSDEDKPQHSFEPEELEIIKVEEVVQKKITSYNKDPNFEYKQSVKDCLEKKYGDEAEDPDTTFLKRRLELFDEDGEFDFYSWIDAGMMDYPE